MKNTTKERLRAIMRGSFVYAIAFAVVAIGLAGAQQPPQERADESEALAQHLLVTRSLDHMETSLAQVQEDLIASDASAATDGIRQARRGGPAILSWFETEPPASRRKVALALEHLDSSLKAAQKRINDGNLRAAYEHVRQARRSITAIYRHLDDEPGGGDLPPSTYTPPELPGIEFPEDAGPEPELSTTWAGVKAQLKSDRQNPRLEGGIVTKIEGISAWGVAAFDNVEIQNEGAMFAVGVFDNMPSDLGPDETWQNSARATPDKGTIAFRGCDFGPAPGEDSWAGYGGKMWLHPQSVASYLLDQCTFDPVREHGFYGEWTRALQITNCLFLDTGGNAIQVASRGGRPPVEPFGPYYYGNPLNRPAGLNGWALIENVEIEEQFHNFRDASDVSFFGFLGPIVIEDLTCTNTIGGIAITLDPFKGAWLYPDGNPTEPILWRSGYETENPPAGIETYLSESGTALYPVGYYGNAGVWINDLEIRVQTEGQGPGRPLVMLAGCEQVHIGRFDIDSGLPAIVFDNWYGGQVRNKRRPGTDLPNVYFYDEASVWAHEGRIGEEVPHPTQENKGKYRAFSHEELEALIVRPVEPAGASR